MTVDNNQFMLVEKYRPQNLKDMILPEQYKEQVQEWINDAKAPNMLLSSTAPGLGKTTLVHVLSNELEAETLFINASLENGIDVLRSKISSFAGSVSFDGNQKIVILDECDHITQNAQAGFRGLIDEYSKNCAFIFTCNYRDKIIKPLQDRLVKFDFDEIFHDNKKEIATDLMKRLKFILDNEGIEYEMQDVKQIILNLYPGIRDATMYIQNCTVQGVLHIQDSIQKSVQYNTIVESIKDNNFTKMRQQISTVTNPDTIYTWLWNNLNVTVQEQSQPQAILIIAKYQYQSTSAVDKELNAAAMCTELMGAGIKFK